MTDLLHPAVEQAIGLYDAKVGEGDITTESLWPYARHTVAEVHAEEEVPACSIPLLEALVKHSDPSISVQTPRTDVSVAAAGEMVARLEGNGRAILTSWRIAKPIMTFLSVAQRRVQAAVDVLQPAGLAVTHNLDLPVGYDRLASYAVEEGGGVSFASRLDEIVYLSSDHVRWVGSLDEALRRTFQEVGRNRTLIKVVVELASPEDATFLGETKVDMVYGRKFTVDDVHRANEITRGWTKLTVDETIPLEKVSSLKEEGVRMYMVNVNHLLLSGNLFSIYFAGSTGDGASQEA